MNAKTLSIAIIALGVTLGGCDNNDDKKNTSDGDTAGSNGAPATGGANPGGAAGAATEEGGGQGGAASGSAGASSDEDLASSVDPAAAAEIAASEAETAEIMLELKEVTHAFVEDDPTLDTALSAVENAAAIHDQISSVLADVCPTVSPTREALSASVSVEFDECTLPGGTTVSGEVSVAVERNQLGGVENELVVTFTFTAVEFGDVQVNGYVMVSTQDMTTYPISAELEINTLGTLTFDGFVSADMEDSALAATLDGSGTLVPSEALLAELPDVTSGAWTCEQAGATNLEISNLHRFFESCYADSGAVMVTQSFECSLLRKTAQANLAVTLEWDSSTPETGEITATTAVTVGDQSSTSEPEQVMLPWSCE